MFVLCCSHSVSIEWLRLIGKSWLRIEAIVLIWFSTLACNARYFIYRFVRVTLRCSNSIQRNYFRVVNRCISEGLYHSILSSAVPQNGTCKLKRRHKNTTMEQTWKKWGENKLSINHGALENRQNVILAKQCWRRWTKIGGNTSHRAFIINL